MKTSSPINHGNSSTSQSLSTSSSVPLCEIHAPYRMLLAVVALRRAWMYSTLWFLTILASDLLLATDSP